ncbi:MAG: hypothetical protein ACPHO8_15390, partial [Mariniblastus sp.]
IPGKNHLIFFSILCPLTVVLKNLFLSPLFPCPLQSPSEFSKKNIVETSEAELATGDTDSEIILILSYGALAT